MGKGGRRRIKGLRARKSVFIGAWVPESVVKALDKALQDSRINRSEFLRRALWEKVEHENK
jgi:hypothetical protein